MNFWLYGYMDIYVYMLYGYMDIQIYLRPETLDAYDISDMPDVGTLNVTE